MALPTVPSLKLITERLPLIFPEGTANRGYAVREMSARTIFVMFYAGAISGANRWIRPSHVTDMTNIQAEALDDASREAWVSLTSRTKKNRPADAWYAPNSREPIRDETLRNALIPTRAVVERTDIATTSSHPRYALGADFANLFDAELTGDSLAKAIEAWKADHLSKAALVRQQLVKQGLSKPADVITVTFPNGEVRQLKPGPSSMIAKAVIEVFAPRFLRQPAVLWLSESGNKVVARDDALAGQLGLKIDASKALPDIILVDLGDADSGADMLVVFAEVVATDGPISTDRKFVLTALAIDAGFDKEHLAFLTAYLDRSRQAFRKSVSELAWGSYAWFVAEPEHLVILHGAGSRKLAKV